DGDDPDLHVVAVAQLTLIAAASKEPAAHLLMLAAGLADVGETFLRQLDGSEVETHLFVRLEQVALRVRRFTAAKDTGIDAVSGELPQNIFAEPVPRHG